MNQAPAVLDHRHKRHSFARDVELFSLTNIYVMAKGLVLDVGGEVVTEDISSVYPELIAVPGSVRRPGQVDLDVLIDIEKGIIVEPDPGVDDALAGVREGLEGRSALSRDLD